MNRLLIVVSCYFAVVYCGRSTRNILDNEVDTGSAEFNDPQLKSWVRITKLPPKEVTVNFGEVVELECEANGGYPAPIIQWYKDNVKITDNERFSNYVSNYPLKGLAKPKASIRFLADKTDVYFCRAQSGNKVVRASTKVNVIGKHLNHFVANEIRDLKEEPTDEELNRAKIAFYDTIHMNNIGDVAEIPCKATGSPTPDSIWLDADNEYIEPGTDPRFIILPSGGLRISDLKWKDMGPYTCVARNSLGQDSIQTFLYPMLADK